MEFGKLIEDIFKWALALVGLAVFINFLWAGLLWFTSRGNTGIISSAKEKMFNSVIGAIILLASYLILNTINPDLVRNTFKLPGLGGGGGGGGGGAEFVACDNPPNTKSPDPMPVILQVKSEFPNIDLTREGPGSGTRDEFTAIVAWRLSQTDSNWGRKKSSAGAPVSTDTLGYKREDIGPGRFEAIDLIAGAGTLQRGCVGIVSSSQVWVQAVQAP